MNRTHLCIRYATKCYLKQIEKQMQLYRNVCKGSAGLQDPRVVDSDLLPRDVHHSCTLARPIWKAY